MGLDAESSVLVVLGKNQNCGPEGGIELGKEVFGPRELMNDNRRRKSRLLRIETGGGKLWRGEGVSWGAGRELPGQDYIPQHALARALESREM